MTRALVTRPLEDATGIADALRQRGIDPVIEPLLHIKPVEAPLPPLDGVRALLFTSANGVRAFAARSDRRDIAVLAVGAATAEAARAAGFASVESADGDVGALAGLVATTLKPADGPLVHVAGSVAAGDLAGRLREQGYKVERLTLYEAEPAAALSPPVVDELAAGRIDWVLLFSPRTAATFARLVREAKREKALERCTAICLSQPVAEAASSLPWHRVRIAAKPDQAHLLAEIDNLQAGEKREAGQARAAVPGAPAPRSRGSLVASVVSAAATVVVIAAALASTAPWWREHLFPMPAPSSAAPPADSGRVDALGARVEAMQREIAAMPRATPGTSGGPDPRLAKVEGDLTQRLTQLTAELETLRGRVATLGEAEQSGADKRSVTEIGDRTGRLADQVTQLQQRVAAAEQAQQAKSGSAARSAAIAVGVAQLADTARAGRPFEAGLRAVEALGPDPAIAGPLHAIEPYAARGVATLDVLRRDWAEAARRAKAAQVATRYDGWMGRVMAWLQGAVTIRRVGADVVGEDAEALLARAGARLDADDLAGALAVLEPIGDPAASVLRPWLERARARLAVDQALAKLGPTALRGVAAAAGG